ncbi:chaperone protein dnaJ, partial [Haematococcus lacustris]
MPVQERGEAADEYMQWLWMNQDWRRWEGDEPWNWDEQQRWASAEEIARCTMQRKVARLSWLQRLMSDSKLLAAGDITTETVKSAFKAQAKLLHPDSVMAAGGDVAQQRQASGDFQKLQMAYDVLRDPEKRRAYDQGQLVH